MNAIEAHDHCWENPARRGVHDRFGDAHWIDERTGRALTLAQAQPFAEGRAPYSPFPRGAQLIFCRRESHGSVLSQKESGYVLTNGDVRATGVQPVVDR